VKWLYFFGMAVSVGVSNIYKQSSCGNLLIGENMNSYSMYGVQPDGQKPLINVSKVANGWIVMIHQINRDKEVSPETLEKRRIEKEEKDKKYLEDEKQRITKDLMTQFAGMALIGELAGKAQVQGIEEELEPWKESKKMSHEDLLKKIKPIANKIARETATGRPRLFPYEGLIGSAKDAVETHIFTEREEMIKFVSAMLLPVIE